MKRTKFFEWRNFHLTWDGQNLENQKEMKHYFEKYMLKSHHSMGREMKGKKRKEKEKEI